MYGQSPWRNRLARSAVKYLGIPKGWWFKPTRGRLSFNFSDSQTVSAPNFSVTFKLREKKVAQFELITYYVKSNFLGRLWPGKKIGFHLRHQFNFSYFFLSK